MCSRRLENRGKIGSVTSGWQKLETFAIENLSAGRAKRPTFTRQGGDEGQEAGPVDSMEGGEQPNGGAEDEGEQLDNAEQP